MYCPKMGRFLSEDPIGLEGGDPNLYRYGGNNPMTNVDPSGLCYTGCFGSVPGYWSPSLDLRPILAAHDARAASPPRPKSVAVPEYTYLAQVLDASADQDPEAAAHAARVQTWAFEAAPPKSWWREVTDWWRDVWNCDFIDEEGVGLRPGDGLVTSTVRRLVHQDVKPIAGGAKNTAQFFAVDVPTFAYEHSTLGMMVNGPDYTLQRDRERLATVRSGAELISNWHQVPDHMKGRYVKGFVAGQVTAAGIGIAAARTMAAFSAANRPILREVAPGEVPASSGVVGSTADLRSVDSMHRGNVFNQARAAYYPYHNVYVENPSGGYFILDSYGPRAGEIVSRKFTQLSQVSEATAKAYIREAATKYPPGATIANVPSNGALAGQKLQGRLYLELPIQKAPVPRAVLDAARARQVIIRDAGGTVY